MDKRYLESPAHRQYVATILQGHANQVAALQEQIKNRDVEVTHVMLELAQSCMKSVNEILTKLLVP